MSFIITPCGEYESSFLRFIFSYTYPGRSWEGGYYGVLLNSQGQDILNRAATFSILADTVHMASFDWMIREADREYLVNRDYNNPELDIKFSYNGPGEWDEDLTIFAGILLKKGIFDRDELARMGEGLKKAGRHSVPNLGSFEANSFQYVCRILHQLRTSSESRSTLLLSEDDRKLVEKIGQAVLAEKRPSPFPLPDTSVALTGKEPEFGLLLFQPPDFEATLAVRANPLILKYTRKVREYFTKDSVSREQGMLVAMREAAEKNEIAEKVKFVFEAETWIWRALHFAPDMHGLSFFGELITDVIKTWIGRRQRELQWHLIGPKMQEIALQEYLRRKDNITLQAKVGKNDG